MIDNYLNNDDYEPPLLGSDFVKPWALFIDESDH